MNGRPARRSTRVQPGDEVVVRLAVPPPAPRHDDAALALIHEGTHLVALDKPPGMPSTLGRSPHPSVAALLARRFPETAALDPHGAAGLVHRLDTGTSGLLMAARDPDTYARLRAAFRAKRVVKHYLAIVHGQVTAPVTIDRPLRRPPRRRRRMLAARPDQPHAWPATTHVRPLASNPTLTLVHLQMRTGVTHQLRAHLAQLGHPVVGDDRYGGLPPPTAAAADGSWHYLHAAAVELDEPGLPARLHTAPPHHWLPLLGALDWSPALADPARIGGGALVPPPRG